MMFEKRNRIFQQRAQALVSIFLFLALGRLRLQLDAGALRQMAQRFGKIPAFLLHHKLEDIAALVTLPKAAPRPRLWKDHKSWRTRIGVKRAETSVILTTLPQLHRLRHKVHNINA